MIKLLALMVMIQQSLSLKSTDVCRLLQKECTGYYDSNRKYKIKCDTIECHGKYRFKCGRDKCTLGETECYSLQKWALDAKRNQLIYNIFPMPSNSQKKSGYTELSKFQVFNQSIKNCSHIAYQFKTSDICVSGTNCFEKSRLFMGQKNNDLTRKVDCKCTNKHNYRCGGGDGLFCATNNTACEYYLRLKISKKLPQLKKCGNDNVIIFRKFSLFW